MGCSTDGSAQEAEIKRRSLEVLDEFNMTHMQDEFAGALSGGQRKLLEMARAMMAKPRMIMLDEPMAGVNPALTQSLLGHVKRLRSEGITVLFVEHDMDVVQDISDWVVVMAEGLVIAEGPPRSIGENAAVVDAYLGSSHAAFTEEIREVGRAGARSRPCSRIWPRPRTWRGTGGDRWLSS